MSCGPEIRYPPAVDSNVEAQVEKCSRFFLGAVKRVNLNEQAETECPALNAERTSKKGTQILLSWVKISCVEQGLQCSPTARFSCHSFPGKFFKLSSFKTFIWTSTVPACGRVVANARGTLTLQVSDHTALAKLPDHSGDTKHHLKGERACHRLNLQTTNVTFFISANGGYYTRLAI